MTDNPILRDEVLGRWSVSAPRPVPTGNTRLVFVDGRGQLYAPLEPLTVGETVWRGLRRVYEVDMAEHAAECRMQLPCHEPGFSFDAELHFAWRVHLPERIVQDRRTDVAPLYTSHLRSCLLAHSEEYGLEEREIAQRALGAKLADRMMLDEGITILRCTVTLTLGDEAERYLADRVRARFEVEADEFKMRRMRRFKEAVATGDTSLIMALIHDNPGELKDVIKLMLDQRDANFDKARLLVSELFQQGLLDKGDVDGVMDLLRQGLRGSFDPGVLNALLMGQPGPAVDPGRAGLDAIPEGRVVDDDDEDDEDFD